MTVRLESAIKRYIGTSDDIKPRPESTGETLPAGSSFLESDTGRIWRWDGFDWTNFAGADEQAALLGAIYLELTQLRRALTLTGLAQHLD